MVRMWETTESFPFRTLRGLGGALLGFGIALIVLGAFDVIWTVVEYTDQYNDCPDKWDSELDDPCKHDDLIWTWTAEGIWGGFLVLLVGIIGLIFSRWRVRSLRLQKDMFGIGCGLLVFPICPAIIALSILELIYGLDIFYYIDDGKLVREDITKFIVPLLTGFMAFLAWLVAIAGASVAICCAKIGVTETVYAKQPSVMPQTAMQPIVMAQQQQPKLLQLAAPAPQPETTQYEVVAIAQAPPAPYYVTAPMGAPPPMGPHMGPSMMGPPMMGPPMMGPPMMGPPMMGPPMMGPPMMGPPMMGPPMGRSMRGPPMMGPHMMGPPMMGPPPPMPYGRRGRPPLPMLPPPEAYM